MKKIRGDKPIGVYNTYMEISQGNSLSSSYLYLKQVKMSCFSFYIFSFFSYKIRKQEGRTILPRERAGNSRRWKVLGKEGRSVNKVQKNAYTCK
jgi:hypothetical protein